MKGIVKTYPGGIVALRGVDFDLRRGEIHALLGENGAGKTTLMKILAGCLEPDEGEIYVKGRKIRFKSPKDAMKNGIGMVHQHFTLIPSLTVAENIVLGMQSETFIKDLKLDIDSIAKDIKRFSEAIGLPIDPYVPVSKLSASMKQRVEILRLLYRNVDILILDEPTSILSPIEIKELFNSLRELSRKGKSIILVTHKLHEALEISDRITVLRRGKVVAVIEDPRKISTEELAELVVGTKIIPQIEKKPIEMKRREPLLIIENLKACDDRGVMTLRGLSLKLYPGEILGIAGIVGNGQKELVEVITGLRSAIEGRVIFMGTDITNKSVTNIIRLGVSYIPEDRVVRGVALDLSVAENTVLKDHDKEPFCKRGILNPRSIINFAERIIKVFKIVTPSVKVPVRTLSGGNIQRLVIGRELSRGPKLIIAEQPTAGLDILSMEYVHKLLVDLRNRGCGVLLISYDLDEILKLSDRVAIMYEGRIVKVYNNPKEIDVKELSKYMLIGGI